MFYTPSFLRLSRPTGYSFPQTCDSWKVEVWLPSLSWLWESRLCLANIWICKWSNGGEPMGAMYSGISRNHSPHIRGAECSRNVIDILHSTARANCKSVIKIVETLWSHLIRRSTSHEIWVCFCLALLCCRISVLCWFMCSPVSYIA